MCAETSGGVRILSPSWSFEDGFAARGDVEGEQLEFVLDVGEAAAHEAFDGVDGAGGIRDEALAGFGAGDDFARGQTETTLGTMPERMRGPVRSMTDDQAVGGAEVDADDVGFRFAEINLQSGHEVLSRRLAPGSLRSGGG